MNGKKIACWLRLGHSWKLVAHDQKVLECRRCGEVKAGPGWGAAVTGPM